MRRMTWRASVDRHDPPRCTAFGRLDIFDKGDRPAYPVAVDHASAYLYYGEELADARKALYVINGAAWYVAAWHPTETYVVDVGRWRRKGMRRLILHPLPVDAGTYFQRPARVYLVAADEVTA
jgi:hypothetical protein